MIEWKKVKLSDILKRNKEIINIDENKNYEQVTISAVKGFQNHKTLWVLTSA